MPGSWAARGNKGTPNQRNPECYVNGVESKVKENISKQAWSAFVSVRCERVRELKEFRILGYF